MRIEYMELINETTDLMKNQDYKGKAIVTAIESHIIEIQRKLTENIEKTDAIRALLLKLDKELREMQIEDTEQQFILV